MKKIIIFIFCFVIISTQSILSQTLLWTSPTISTQSGGTSGWLVLKYEPLELRFYYYDETTNKLTITDGPLSSNIFSEITMDSIAGGYEEFNNYQTYDFSGDGLNDIVLRRAYSSPSFNYGFRVVDVATGQTLYTFDNGSYHYFYEGQITPDINNDGTTELVVLRSSLDYSSSTYLVYSTNGIASAISGDVNNIPSIIHLNQNYPNPFNPSTKIKYSIDSPEKISIKIYNVSGQLIKEINREHNQAGEYEVIWDGKNNFGQKVSSGAYFYQLTAGNYTEAKKMILLE